VGCGPAYYFDRLPEVNYVGFDTCAPYVSYARRRYGDRGEFRCETLTPSHLQAFPPFDAVLLFGLLHHLSDEDCTALLDLTAKALTPAGRVISVDPCLHTGQGRISRWMSRNDRGEYVREPRAFEALASACFGEVSSTLLDTVSRVPASHHMMRLSHPLAPFAPFGRS
jgi:methyltransferase family protein